MKTRFQIILLLITVLAMALSAAFPQTPQPKPAMPPIDGIGRIQQVLRDAGAPLLTAEQQNGIRALIAEFRKAPRQPDPGPTLQAARKAYESAILNKNLNTAASQALTIANAQAEAAAQRETDLAAFAIEVIKILETNPSQVEALIAQVGKNGFVRFIINLAAAPAGPGPGPQGRGPRPGGPQPL